MSSADGGGDAPAEKKGRIEPLRSFVEVPEDHDFSINNLPFGVFSLRDDADVRGWLDPCSFRSSCP